MSDTFSKLDRNNAGWEYMCRLAKVRSHQILTSLGIPVVVEPALPEGTIYMALDYVDELAEHDTCVVRETLGITGRPR